jgi:transcriptional regulator with XRE-family HTH domain
MLTNDKILIKFGEKIRKLRKKLNLSQEDLAYKAELHRTYIGMIERGEKNITLVNIEKLSNALNIELKSILDFSDV